MSYAMMIKENISKYPDLKIIDAHKLYKEKFSDISEQAYYKTFSRMVKAGELNRVTKGIYCVPKKGRFGVMVSSEKDIFEYYLGSKNNKGMIIGYRMYNKYRLTTQVSKNVEIYSRVILQKKKNIKNITINRVNIQFNTTTIKLIELLEVLQNYRKIEDLNYANLIKFIEDSVKYYNDRILDKLIRVIDYKKSTLASLKSVLDYYGKKNTINKYLNRISKYNVLRMEELNEITS